MRPVQVEIFFNLHDPVTSKWSVGHFGGAMPSQARSSQGCPCSTLGNPRTLGDFPTCHVMTPLIFIELEQVDIGIDGFIE
jgi:hypothetical protein